MYKSPVFSKVIIIDDPIKMKMISQMSFPNIILLLTTSMCFSLQGLHRKPLCRFEAEQPALPSVGSRMQWSTAKSLRKIRYVFISI